MLRLWLSIRRSGWFRPSNTGGLLPMPVRWQGWVATLALIVAIAGSGLLPGRSGWPTRIGITAGYIALGVATYE